MSSATTSKSSFKSKTAATASAANAASSATSKNPLKGAVEIIPDRLYYCALKTPPSNPKILLRSRRDSSKKLPTICFNIDDELVYWNFFLDFGPLNLGQLYRFTIHLNELLNEYPNTNILFYSSPDPAKRANAAFLICAWQVLELKRTPDQAYYGFTALMKMGNGTKRRDGGDGGAAGNDDEVPPPPPTGGSSYCRPPCYPLSPIGRLTVAPLPYWHDASPCQCTYKLNLYDCLLAIVKAQEYKFFDWDTFDVEEYEYFEQVENGDLNWIMKGKILAFAGPSYKKTVSPEGYCTLAPADYIPYFKKKKVGLVVRLNKKNYEEQDFIDAGIQHLEQYYLDGSCPPMKILQKVLAEFESVKSDEAFAVHCKAGLGRTGTCIGAYIMKHYRLTAPEVIAWMRICRPGCVIGPQQQFLEDLQPVMWQEGELMRTSLTANQISDTTRGRNSGKSSSSKSKSSNSRSPRTSRKSPPSPESPKSVTVNDESIEGRPGQADGLLARRNRQTRATTAAAAAVTTTTPATPNSMKDGMSGGRKPVPVTPDS
mmetsp:Transcript_40190/g.97082  ORF Transcript_40190/g.97082 Transcript_40190/m.97082 type:complete len:541 (+) Transcript_40190:676-2298(+)